MGLMNRIVRPCTSSQNAVATHVLANCIQIVQSKPNTLTAEYITTCPLRTWSPVRAVRKIVVPWRVLPARHRRRRGRETPCNAVSLNLSTMHYHIWK